MNKQLQTVAIRHQAVYIPETSACVSKTLREPAASLAVNLAKLGFRMDEPLLHQVNQLPAPAVLAVYDAFRETLQVNRNWTPLVKGWDQPTNEKRSHHWITAIANIFREDFEGTTLACGHLIPDHTFPLERYNGCPFCGTPFETGGKIFTGQGSTYKLLTLWTDASMQTALHDLLTSKTALDATQADSLRILLAHYPLPDVAIGMKETLMLVISALAAAGKGKEAGKFLQAPGDILRYLWFRHTGFLQIVQPSVIVKRTARNHLHVVPGNSKAQKAQAASKARLKLKYGRKEARMVAGWINDMPLSAEKAAEQMHPKREIWVRYIRALRLAEFSHRPGMEKLARLLDVFYHRKYEVWAGKLEQARIRHDAATAFGLLQERPGQFARALFSNMLWFGKEDTLQAFGQVKGQVPARLLLTLNSYAENYFVLKMPRAVKPLGGTAKQVKPNQLLALYPDEQREAMAQGIEQVFLESMFDRYAAQPTASRTLFIDPVLQMMPMPVGERSENVQDLPSALMGTRFPVPGNQVRLFMQWGKNLPAQHLDMDLSAAIVYEKKTEICNFGNLSITGARHSGDIRAIPNWNGTAEYIDIDIDVLQKAGARYAVFTCNAYSHGAISPNLVTGWMNSAHRMQVDADTGVAYDPSCVEHQVLITQSLTKGLIFGVLDMAAGEIIWLEQAFNGQTVHSLNLKTLQLQLAKLQARTTVGRLLELKAQAQGLTIVQEAQDADEAYTKEWARNIAAVTQLLTD
ncbi:hypothetical protein [Chitinophaga caseinilytica]|uniref:hypothetical protein n=1 Tax=Chitinophaga caseinilytica TaxID=2267521 RepID=UPI003C2ACC78